MRTSTRQDGRRSARSVPPQTRRHHRPQPHRRCIADHRPHLESILLVRRATGASRSGSPRVTGQSDNHLLWRGGAVSPAPASRNGVHAPTSRRASKKRETFRTHRLCPHCLQRGNPRSNRCRVRICPSPPMFCLYRGQFKLLHHAVPAARGG